MITKGTGSETRDTQAVENFTHPGANVAPQRHCPVPYSMARGSGLGPLKKLHDVKFTSY